MLAIITAVTRNGGFGLGEKEGKKKEESRVQGMHELIPFLLKKLFEIGVFSI